jgi:hypothetical protein
MISTKKPVNREGRLGLRQTSRSSWSSQSRQN